MQIYKNIPIPSKRRKKNGTYGWHLMEIGDSILTNSLGFNVARMYKQRHPGWDYTAKTQPDGSIRIWRTA